MPPAPELDAGGGDFGEWVMDEDSEGARLPAFRLHPASDRPGPSDIWHQVGNDRLTATAHADGHIVIYSTEAGWVRLNGVDPSKPRHLGGRWRWEGADGSLIAAFGVTPSVATWEVGAATWEAHGPGWSIQRRVWAPFGQARLLRIDIDVRTDDPRLQGGQFREMWGVQPEPIVLGGLMSRPIPAPTGYSMRERISWNAAFSISGASRWATDSIRSLLARRLALRPVRVGPAHSAIMALQQARRPKWLATGRSSPLAAIQDAIFVAAIDPQARAEARLGRQGVQVESTVDLPSAPSARVSFIVGMAEPAAVPGLVTEQSAISLASTRSKWRATWELKAPSQPVLERESAWHATQLRSAQVHDRCFATSFVAQGSAYGFIHGLQGAPRDYAIFMGPTCLVDPAGARSMLLTMLRLQRRDGSLMYAHTGAGWRTSTGIHTAPTDLPIALLWAATDYAWSTGDQAVLDEVVPWPASHRGTSELRAAFSPAPTPHLGAGGASVLERLLLSWRYLRDDVGLGPNGLVRVGSGDWNDPITAMAPNRRAFREDGESVYNSAFAAYVIPRAARLLESRSPDAADEMRAWSTRLRTATASAWNGRWFRRAWDGRGGTIGDDRLFLDANAWCLIAGLGTRDQQRRLVAEMRERVINPSPIGPMCPDRPTMVRGATLAPGWDTNGGVWAALAALLSWGLSRDHPDLALECLRKQTFAAHARAYPGTWLGIWSGPDAYNAYYARDPGGTFVQPATPMAEFPIMNANANAGPLLALTRVLGMEPGPNGMTVRGPSPIGPWELSSALGRFSSGDMSR